MWDGKVGPMLLFFTGLSLQAMFQAHDWRRVLLTGELGVWGPVCYQ